MSRRENIASLSLCFSFSFCLFFSLSLAHMLPVGMVLIKEKKRRDNISIHVFRILVFCVKLSFSDEVPNCFLIMWKSV